jgi:sugar lactone lactonase YvrE
MPRTSVRAAIGAVALLTVLTAAPAFADDGRAGGGRSDRTFEYPLPGAAVFPEGVDTFDRYFYVTSTTNGDVFRGRIRDKDSARVFLPGGTDGRTTAVGIEATDDLLVIAGGGTGTVFVYERDSKRFLGRHTVPNATGAPTFLNDLAITRDGDVYVTDSARDIVFRIDEDDLDETSEMQEFAVFGADDDPVGPFNANGIVATRDGRHLIVVQSDTGNLFRVSVGDAAIRPIDLSGATVAAGDGMEIKNRTLYVVRNSEGVITELRLRDDFTSGRVVGETRDPSFKFPTTAALDHGRLLVVNSQFNRRETANPVLPFTLSSIDRP